MKDLSWKAAIAEILKRSKDPISYLDITEEIIARPIGRHILEPDQSNRAYDLMLIQYQEVGKGELVQQEFARQLGILPLGQNPKQL